MFEIRVCDTNHGIWDMIQPTADLAHGQSQELLPLVGC